MKRRAFVSKSMVALGGLPLFTRLSPLVNDSDNPVSEKNKMKLMATTDYTDNIFVNNNGSRYGEPVARDSEYYRENKCFMDKEQLDRLHQFLASQGVVRHQWIVDTYWTLYENYPHGFDLLEEAAKSAHKYGIEFYGEIKPFEGGGFGTVLPHSMPFPKKAVAFKDIRGIIPRACRFAAANPLMCLKRRPGTYECEDPIASIRLVKSDDKPTCIKSQHLTIYTSAANNHFESYTGPVTFSETVEKRYRFPYWRKCRVLHLDNLRIPQGHKYILIKYSSADSKGNFSNEKGNIIELVTSDGKILPHTLSTGPVQLEQHYESLYKSEVLRKLLPYLQQPEVQEEINNVERMQEHYRDFYTFGEYNLTDWVTLDKQGYLALACGKPEFMLGNLHPVYPEVRKHWLELVQFCLDRGVDGINFRVANHTRSPELWEYGFNQPVLDATSGDMEYPVINKVNGDAYTQFLREARSLIKSKGKSVTIHLTADMLMDDNRPNKISSNPFNFEWQWKTWVKEIADELEFRGVFKMRPWNLKKVLDIFSAETRVCNKPFYLQGDFHGMKYEGPFYNVEEELKLNAEKHPGLDGYVLYETAYFTRVNDKGEVEGSPGIKKVLSEYDFTKMK